MRPIKWKLLVVAAASFWTASLAESVATAQPKNDKKDKPAAAAAGPEIEIDPTDTKPAAGTDPGEIDMDPNKQGDLNADLNAADATETAKANGPLVKTPLSWSDIRVVVRKPFLKQKRTELLPMLSTTVNDNMIRHVGFGGQINYFLTDVLAVGVEGQYFTSQFREPFDLVARQARRLPTVNKYNFAASLNFHYVPVYGKFAVLDKKLITWEAYFTAGLGIAQSEVVPRDAKFPGFTTLLIQPNVGVAMRFFLTKFLTINFGVRNYMFIDKFEPVDRSAMKNATAADAKSNADSSFINNVMFQFSLAFWVPTSFEYTTFR
jgi:outer membrane beta-barrel protein